LERTKVEQQSRLKSEDHQNTNEFQLVSGKFSKFGELSSRIGENLQQIAAVVDMATTSLRIIKIFMAKNLLDLRRSIVLAIKNSEN
jgi:hypothetical protein